MALAHSPKVVTDGLVFYMDQGNVQKSWKGAPATNLFTETNLNNWTKSAVTSTSQFTTPFGDPAYVITDDNTAGWENLSRSVTVANDSSSHTMSCMVRKTYGGTSARLGFNASYSGGTSVTVNPRFNSDTGVATYGTVIDYGDWWYWYYTTTNNSTGNTSLNYNFYPATGVYNGNDDSTATGTAIIGAFMLVAGSVAARFVNGTRSNTEAILDLTRQNTITANTLTYASNGTFSFGGSDRLNFTLSGSAASNEYTRIVWIKPTQSTADMKSVLLNQIGNNSDMAVGIQDNRAAFHQYTRTGTSGTTDGDYTASGSTPLSTNTIYMIAITVNRVSSTDNINIYLNGRLDGTASLAIGASSSDSAIIGGPGIDGYGGARMFYGDCYSAAHYNRVLTSAEILQNFNAHRGRYGV